MNEEYINIQLIFFKNHMSPSLKNKCHIVLTKKTKIVFLIVSL